MTAADSTAEQYANVMNSLIADCTRLEDRVAELEAQSRPGVENGVMHVRYFSVRMSRKSDLNMILWYADR